MKIIKIVLAFLFFFSFTILAQACEGSGFGILLSDKQINFDKIKSYCTYSVNSSLDENEIQYKSKVNKDIIVSVSRKKDDKGKLYHVLSYYDPELKLKFSDFESKHNHKKVILDELTFLKNNNLINISETDIKSIVDLFTISGFVYQVDSNFKVLPSSPEFSYEGKRLTFKSPYWLGTPNNISVKVGYNDFLIVGETLGDCGQSINFNLPIAILELGTAQKGTP